MERDEILKFLKDNISFLNERYNVSKIGLFGSYAKNRASSGSDIDIIVSMPSGFDNYYDLKEYLEANLKQKVDLGLEKNLRELIRERINEEVIYV